MFDEVISYYLNITAKTKLADVQLKHVIEKIQSDPDIERTIKQIRSQTDKQLRNQLKRRLPAVAVSGTFKDRRSLEHYSGLVQVDFDNLENPAQTKEKLKSEPYTYVAFICPNI